MATVDERKALRVELLLAAYKAHEGPGRGRLDYEVWTREHQADGDEVQLAMRWLKDRGFVTFPLMAPIAEITADGIDEAERHLAADSPPTAGVDHLAVLSVDHFRQLEAAVAEIREFLAEHKEGMNPVDAQDLAAQADTIEVQARSPRPRRGIVGAALSAALWLADNAAGEVAGSGALLGVQTLAKALGF